MCSIIATEGILLRLRGMLHHYIGGTQAPDRNEISRLVEPFQNGRTYPAYLHAILYGDDVTIPLGHFVQQLFVEGLSKPKS
jgi:hypothetical protein